MDRARARSLGFDRPVAARGIVPLILGALSVGNAIYKAVNANQQKQRQKGYIDDAYRSAVQRQQVKEGDVREGTAESLAARGLLTNGAVQPAQSRIAQAMGAQTGGIAPSHSLGERAQNENSREFALERYDLDAARNQAQRENKADALDKQISAVVGGAIGAGSAYNLSQLGNEPAASGGVDPATQEQVNQIGSQPLPPVRVTPSSSAIGSAMGLENPANWWGGIHPLDPVNHPDSSWAKQTITGHGEPNSDFHL